MGFAALRLLAQAAEESNRGLLIGLYGTTITAVGGIIAGAAALLSNRRQARSDARSRVREDLGFTLEEYRNLIAALRAAKTETEEENDRLRAELAAVQEELTKCRERARTRRR